MSTTTPMSFDAAVGRVREELAAAAFGVLTEIDVAGETRIAAVNAEQMLSIVANHDLAPTADEVRRRLSSVVARAAGTQAAECTGRA